MMTKQEIAEYKKMTKDSKARNNEIKESLKRSDPLGEITIPVATLYAYTLAMDMFLEITEDEDVMQAIYQEGEEV